jgi:hypothetical protein
MRISHLSASALALVLCLGTGVARAQDKPASLPMGKTGSGRASDSAPGVYQFSASSAGVLSVAVRAESDVMLAVTDEVGQSLPDGTTDRDLFGSGGNEILSVAIPERGTYRLEVRILGGGSTTFEIGAAWIAMPAFAAATPDADRRPDSATPLEVGASREDSLNTAEGDHWDWFTITPKTAGALTVILRAVDNDSPDLALEIYAADKFGTPIVRSDDDLQNNNSNESATVDVAAGKPVYIKVLGAVGDVSGAYRIASSLIQ